MNRKHLVMILAPLALLISTQVSKADVIPFTLNGTTNDIDSFVFNTASVIFHNAIPLTPDKPFNFYYQSSVAAAQLGGSSVNYPTLNSSTYITAVLGATEQATNVITDTHGNSAATFSLAPVQTVNYLNLYASPLKPDETLGTNYNAPAGSTLILSASIVDERNSGFQVNFNNTVPFQTGNANNPNYSGTPNTLQSPTDFLGNPSGAPGTGGFTVTAAVTYTNPDYFTLPAGLHIQFTLASGSLVDEFSRVNPTDQFVTSGPDGTILPTLGATNLLDGPDGMAQVDSSESFIVTPEPSSMVLSLFGIGGFALRYLQRRSKKAV